MSYLPELQRHIVAYLNGEEDLASLREWLAPLVIDAESNEVSVSRVMYAMQRSISDLAEGYISEGQLKQNFAALLYPSPSPSPIYQVALAGASSESVRTGTSGLIGGTANVAFVGVGRAVGCVS